MQSFKQELVEKVGAEEPGRRAEMPALCGRVREQSGDDLDGFQMMIRCYAGLD